MKTWCGTTPVSCELCGKKFTKRDVFIDGRTSEGFWAKMCSGCHSASGVGLGIGRGQKYSVKTLKKIAG